MGISHIFMPTCNVYLPEILAYAEGWREARDRGVERLVLACATSPEGIEIRAEIAVDP